MTTFIELGQQAERNLARSLVSIAMPRRGFWKRTEVYDYMARRFPDMRYRLMVDDRIEIQNADERDAMKIFSALTEILS